MKISHNLGTLKSRDFSFSGTDFAINIFGRKIRTLVNRYEHVGDYTIIWDGNDNTGQKISSGIYLLIFNTEGYNEIGVRFSV